MTTTVSLAMQTDITLGTAVAATSGTAIDFTGIPAGTKRIVFNFTGVSTSGTSIVMVQLGDAGGFEATGYLGASAGLYVSSNDGLRATTGIAVETGTGAGSLRNGCMILNLLDASTFTWAGLVWVGRSDNDQSTGGGYSKSLSAELTQIRLTTAGGSDTFDAGKVNIQYE